MHFQRTWRKIKIVNEKTMNEKANTDDNINNENKHVDIEDI